MALQLLAIAKAEFKDMNLLRMLTTYGLAIGTVLCRQFPLGKAAF